MGNINSLPLFSKKQPAPPVLKLSAAHLRQIFHETVASVPRGESATRVTLVLSSVCRLWRNIIFADPDLWDQVLLMPGQVDVARRLSRARLLSLRIYSTCGADFSPEEFERIKCFLQAHIDLVVDLELVLHHSDLCIQDSYGRAFRLFQTSSFHNPDDPALPLRALEDDPLGVLFSAPLRLTNLSLVTDESLFPEKVVELLKNCPLLEHIHLQKSHSLSHRTSPFDLSSESSAALPNLKELAIDNYGTPFVSCLLKALEIPATSAVHLRFTQFGPPVMNAAALRPVMARIERATILYQGASEEPNFPPTDFTYSLRSDNTNFTVEWRWWLSDDESPDTRHISWQLFALPSLRALSVRVENVEMDAATWEHVLDGMPALRTLDISCAAPYGQHESSEAISGPLGRSVDAAQAVLLARGRQVLGAAWGPGGGDSRLHSERYMCELHPDPVTPISNSTEVEADSAKRVLNVWARKQYVPASVVHVYRRLRSPTAVRVVLPVLTACAAYFCFRVFHS